VGPDPLRVHRGFAQCARTLIPIFAQQISSLLANGYAGDIELVMTGHSAGAAVATLIYAHLLTNMHKYPMLSDAKLRLSCITFGGPPIFGSPVTQTLAAREAQLPRRGLLLAIVTEGDIIPRMDAAYRMRKRWRSSIWRI